MNVRRRRVVPTTSLLIPAVVSALALGAVGCAGDDGAGRGTGPVTSGAAAVEAPAGSPTEALLAAAYRNDVAAARAAIAAGGDVNAADGTQQNAFLIATSEVGDDPRLLELTLSSGADVQAKDRYDGTGLIRAADRGHVAIVRRLLTTPIEVDHVNRLGWTALLETILLGGGDPRHVEVARLLIDAGVDVDQADSDGVTPLAHAERLAQQPIVDLLVAAGARR